MDDVGLYYGHLVYIFNGHLKYFISIWYTFLLPFGIPIFPVLVPCTKLKSGNPEPIQQSMNA
jgi:hypothetical protein